MSTIVQPTRSTRTGPVHALALAAGGALLLACNPAPDAATADPAKASIAAAAPAPSATPAPAPPAPVLRDTTCVPRRDFGTPAELARFVPAGSRVLCAVAADLDRDSLADWVMVTEAAHGDVGDLSPNEHPRTLRILLREPGGSLRQAVRNDSAVYCYGCGGSFDPFEMLEAGPGMIKVHHMGGRGMRWRADFTFTYAPAADTWRLTEYHAVSLHSGDPDGTWKQKKFRPRDFGVVDLAHFDPESLAPLTDAW